MCRRAGNETRRDDAKRTVSGPVNFPPSRRDQRYFGRPKMDVQPGLGRESLRSNVLLARLLDPKLQKRRHFQSIQRRRKLDQSSLIGSPHLQGG